MANDVPVEAQAGAEDAEGWKKVTNYDADKVASAWASLTEARDFNPCAKHENHTMERAVGTVAGLDVLDLACGDGYYTRYFKRLGAARIVGVDLSKDLINQADAAENILGSRSRLEMPLSLSAMSALGSSTL